MIPGQEGVEALGKLERGAFDALVGDLHMPCLHGHRAYKRARESHRELAPRLVFAAGDGARGVSAAPAPAVATDRTAPPQAHGSHRRDLVDRGAVTRLPLPRR